HDLAYAIKRKAAVGPAASLLCYSCLTDLLAEDQLLPDSK
ncbi:hypothetical protein GGI1_00045, partial [Acidithiobacillus sp. GGI-221]